MNDASPGNATLSPAIVVAAYNRPASLLRLLSGLAKAHYPDQPIPLHISIDQSYASDVQRAAEDFDWPHGPKKVEQHPEHLGLKDHLLYCGDLSQTYGSIILLEDDLFVSPEFYRFAAAGLQFYQGVEQVGGVSLYHYEVAESSQLPFRPVEDGQDLYFMQWPSSWGFAILKEDWQDFREWLTQEKEVTSWLPAFVQAWEVGSWKRLLVAYLRAKNKLFAYPRIGLSTHFGEPGPHTVLQGFQQSPLLSQPRAWRWVSPDDSLAVYDAWFELSPDRLKRLQPDLSSFDFTVDLYGMKEAAAWQGEYLLTSRWVGKEIQDQAELVPRRYAMDLLPVVQNVVASLEGYDLFLVDKAHCDAQSSTVEAYIGKLSGWSRSLIRQGISGDLLRISVVVPESSHSPEAEASIASLLRQEKVQMEVIALVKGELEPSPDDRVRVLAWPEEQDYWAAVDTGFRAASGDLVMWIHPGYVLPDGVLEQVETIFRQYREVDWLLLRPGAETPLAGQRWTQDRFGRASLASLQQSFAPGLSIWRRDFFRSLGTAQDGMIPLLSRAFSERLPYACDLVGASTSSSEVNFTWQDAPQDRHALQAKRTLPGRWLSQLSRPFFLRNGSLRWIHQELEHYPPVIRFAEDLDRWDMQRF